MFEMYFTYEFSKIQKRILKIYEYCAQYETENAECERM